MRIPKLALSIPLAASAVLSSGCAQRVQATREAASAAVPSARPARAPQIPASVRSIELPAADSAPEAAQDFASLESRVAEVEPSFKAVMSSEVLKRSIAKEPRGAFAEAVMALRVARIDAIFAADAFGKARRANDRAALRAAGDELRLRLDAFDINVSTTMSLLEPMALIEKSQKAAEEENKAMAPLVRELEKIDAEHREALRRSEEALRKIREATDRLIEASAQR